MESIMKEMENPMMDEALETEEIENPENTVSFMNRREKRRGKHSKDYAGTLSAQELEHLEKIIYSNLLERRAEEARRIRRYMSGEYLKELEEDRKEMEHFAKKFDFKPCYDDEDDPNNFFAGPTNFDFDGEKSENLYRHADNYTLHLMDEYIADRGVEELANLCLLRKFVKEGTILFNFKREYATASKEVDEWIHKTKECGACLYALTFSA